MTILQIFCVYGIIVSLIIIALAIVYIRECRAENYRKKLIKYDRECKVTAMKQSRERDYDL